jgi:hypothetical protein
MPPYFCASSAYIFCACHRSENLDIGGCKTTESGKISKKGLRGLRAFICNTLGVYFSDVWLHIGGLISKLFRIKREIERSLTVDIYTSFVNCSLHTGTHAPASEVDRLLHHVLRLRMVAFGKEKRNSEGAGGYVIALISEMEEVEEQRARSRSSRDV